MDYIIPQNSDPRVLLQGVMKIEAQELQDTKMDESNLVTCQSN